MTDIPEDVMKAAREALAKVEEIMPWAVDPDGIKARFIARAIVAERERCANIADRWASDEQRAHGNGGPAAAIRGGYND